MRSFGAFPVFNNLVAGRKSKGTKIWNWGKVFGVYRQVLKATPMSFGANLVFDIGTWQADV